MSYLPEGVSAENLLNNIREIGKKISSVLNSYSQSNLNLKEFREKLDIKNIKNDIVTEADLRVNEIIKKSFKNNFSDLDWQFLSEEDYKITNKYDIDDDWVWIIDPLDGTRDFVNQTGEYASHIALSYKKKIIMASVIVPSKDQLWFYTQEKGSWCEDLSNNIIQFPKTKNKKINEIIITKSRSHTNQKLENLLIKLKPKKVIGMGSIGYKITSIIRGQSDLYISCSLPGKSSPRDWDMAAPDGILKGYGGFLTDLDGRQLEYLKDGNFNQEGVIIGSLNPDHYDICKAIKALI